jgi:protein-S-isoprenylcysteine O-methyltransferase Ste14
MARGLMFGLRASAEGDLLGPSTEASCQLIFAALLVGYLLVRYGLDLGKRRDQQAKAAQSRIEKAITWLVWLLLLPAVIYPFTPWLELFHLPFPGWLRGLGGFLFLAGDLLLFWTRQALGKSWSPIQGVDQTPHLVTIGPYRFIRHPMYAAMFLITSGMFLLAANLLVGLPYLIAVTFMYLIWVGPEETGLIAAFGAEYREYILHTGRLLPRLGRYQMLIFSDSCGRS